MAIATATSSRRRIWLPIALVLAVAFWYRQRSPSYTPPKWDVVDFQVKGYPSQEKAYSNKLGSAQDRERPYRTDRNYQAEIEAIRDGPAFQQQEISYDELQVRIQQFIQWDRPYTDHWPAWHDYDNADYDPNRWEGMDRYDEHRCEP